MREEDFEKTTYGGNLKMGPRVHDIVRDCTNLFRDVNIIAMIKQRRNR